MPTGQQDISGGRGILHVPNKCTAPVDGAKYELQLLGPWSQLPDLGAILELVANPLRNLLNMIALS